ncbi:hypothetical protein GQ44DRAFT_716918 [Phaeosphaeriaceae sp. PMI808]|nr:hypothetical protein GQ44DRAFT_716918 [Phaeosphaeriaceae sp. PMI808]
MCFYNEQKVTYDGCTAKPKHVITTRQYDSKGCKMFEQSGHNCGDEAIPAKGLNGEVIQFGTTRQPGACPRCLS